MKKNNNRLYIILAIVGLIGLSWYQLLNTAMSKQAEYDGYIEKARASDDAGVRTDALEAYNEAKGMADSIELREEMAQFYKKNYDENAWGDFCVQIVEDFPTESKSYEILMNYYQTVHDYTMCFSTYDEAKKQHLNTEAMDNIYNKMYYDVDVTTTKMFDVGNFSGGLCPVSTNGTVWGYMTSSGAITIGTSYKKVSGFTSSGFAAVMTDDEQYQIIDTTGEIKYTDSKKDERKITDMGLYSSDKIAAQINGKYCYMDINFEALFGSYDYATTFAGDYAAVQEGDKWKIISSTGEQVGSATFEDIKVDGALVAFRNGVAFAKKDGKYYLINTNGEIICDTAFEDARAFSSEGYAAAKYEGSWGFVDTTGKFIINPQYMDAKSFTNGLAAVTDGEKWGYINDNNDLVIEAEYDDAKEFSDEGSAFVKQGEEWVMIKMYRQTAGA